MQNMKSYFSSWKSFWKSSSSSETLTLAPSSIHFTDSSLGDLKNSTIDEQLMIDISRKLLQSITPPKLQICAHANQWFALNNSHLLVYRQLERIGLCHRVVCDLIRSEDVPMGIRQTLIPSVIPAQEQRSNEDPFMPINDEEPQSQDEVVYCADMQADSCGCLDDEESIDSDDEEDDDEDDDDDDDDEEEEQTGWSNSTGVSTIQSPHDLYDFDDIELDRCSKEMQSLL